MGGALVAPVGTVAWISLSCVTVTATLLPPIFTLVTSVKLKPSSCTDEPGAPAAGLKSVMTGSGAGQEIGTGGEVAVGGKNGDRSVAGARRNFHLQLGVTGGCDVSFESRTERDASENQAGGGAETKAVNGHIRGERAPPNVGLKSVMPEVKPVRKILLLLLT